MRRVRVKYTVEVEGWTAESSDVENWTAFGDSLEEVRELAREALPLVLGEPVRLSEKFPITGNMAIKPLITFTGVANSELPNPIQKSDDLLSIP